MEENKALALTFWGPRLMNVNAVLAYQCHGYSQLL